MIIITIPAYNEEETIGETISEIKEVMQKTDYKFKIQVVDDGSQDKTGIIAKKEGAEVFSHKTNFGLVKTFQTEIKMCLEKKAEIIIHTDADNQYDPSSIPFMIRKIKEGNDLVLGSRFKNKITYKNGISKSLGNILFAKIISKLIKQKITDTTTGYRAFTREVAEKIKIINTFTYTQEQIIKASKLGLKIEEVPIQARKTKRKSKLFKNPFDYAIKAWINILRIYRDYNPLKFFGIIGFNLMIAGIILGLYLVSNFILSGKVGHIPLTILSILLLIMGLQFILFGFLADMKSHNEN